MRKFDNIKNRLNKRYGDGVIVQEVENDIVITEVGTGECRAIENYKEVDNNKIIRLFSKCFNKNN